MTDSRERTLKHVKAALDENAGSKALFRAAKYAVRMRGGTDAVPSGRIAELLEAADERGSLTGKEIADILDTKEMRVEYSSSWSVGGEI